MPKSLPLKSIFKLSSSAMKNDYNKTQRVLMLIKELLKTSTNTIDDKTFRMILGEPSKAQYHKTVDELTTDQGELKALLVRSKMEDNYFYSLNEDYTGIEAANAQTEFMLECYSRLGNVLPDEMQKRLGSIVNQKTNRTRNLDRKFFQVKPIEGLPFIPKQKEIVSTVIKAILEEKEIKIKYKDSKNNVSEFLFKPFTLCLYREELYLLGDRLNNREYEYKNCKMRRILEVEVTNNKFTYPLSRVWNPKLEFQASSGIINNSNESFDVQVNVFGDSRVVFKEKKFFNNKLILSEEQFDTYELTCTSINEFLGQLFIYAQDIEIVNNEMLRSKFLEKAEQAILRNQKVKKAG